MHLMRSRATRGIFDSMDDSMNPAIPILPISRQRISTQIQFDKDDNANKYDIREVDCRSEDGKAHLDMCLRVAMAPNLTFMKIIGINHMADGKLTRAALILYNLIVILIQCIAAVKRATQLRFQVIETRSASVIINLIYVVSGALASIYLFQMGPRLNEIHQKVLEQLAQFDSKMDEIRRVRKYSYILILLMIALAASIAICNTALNVRIESSAYLLPLFSDSLLFIDFYVVFVGECACLVVAALFIICCNILKGSIKKFSGYLQKEGIDNEIVDANDAIQKVASFQETFQELYGAFRVVNKQYSYVHFYVFIVSVPLLCFIIYVSIQMRCEQQFPILEYSVIAYWIVHVLFMLFVFTAPAVQLLGKSRRIARLSAQIFNKLIFVCRNGFLLNAVHYYSNKVSNSQFAFTAGGFFLITKSIIITLLSATMSYFLLLRQFSEQKKCETEFFQGSAA